jgi:hypothetical protein
MRTTIRIDEQLLREAKQQAARSGKSLTALIEDALRESLAHQRRTSKREPVRLITVDSNGLRPGGDLDDSANLLDVMDEPGDPDCGPGLRRAVAPPAQPTGSAIERTYNSSVNTRGP